MCMDTALLMPVRICKVDLILIYRRYNSKGQPVFMTAALGIILDQETNTMKVFGGSETKMVAKNEACLLYTSDAADE